MSCANTQHTQLMDLHERVEEIANDQKEILNDQKEIITLLQNQQPAESPCSTVAHCPTQASVSCSDLLLPALSRVDVLGVVACGRPLQLYVSNKTSGNFDKDVLFSDLGMWKSVVALAGSHQTFSTFFLICTFE